ncbi:hypothetical protein NR798_03525 [Archangium gephyra]|uniref:hypothetical protein n=1 Tax=Archangium gephyra TaxID=48 RepID=UPI0035D3F1E6
MSNVHFIWWGPFNEEKCIAHPNAIADELNGTPHQLYYWCRIEDEPQFKRALRPRIKVVGIRMFQQLALSRTGIWNEPYCKGALDVLKRLDRHKAFSAVKDLMSLLILYLHGGLYLDTTVRLSPAPERMGKPNQQSLRDGLRALGDTPKLPVFGGEQPHQPLLYTPLAVSTGARDYDLGEDTVLQVPVLDVWALYSPAAHPVFETMVNGYVARAERVGVTRSGFTTNLQNFPEGVAPATFGVDLLKDVYGRDGRNELIGNLVIRSVLDGLLSGCPDETDQLAHRFGWPAVELPNMEKRSVLVPTLGITKEYHNSWRR